MHAARLIYAMKPVQLILFIAVFLKVFLRTADEKKCFKILITAQQLQALGQLGCWNRTIFEIDYSIIFEFFFPC